MIRVGAGADRGGDRPPKTYESNFIHHDFIQFGKPSIVLSQKSCEVHVISLTVENP